MTRKRYYRRRGSHGSQILSDTTKNANRLSWRKCIVLGAIGFAIFYWLVPWWIKHQISSQAQSQFFPVIDAILGRRVRALKLVGIAIAFVCVFFAIRNYHAQQQMGRTGLQATGFLARLLARILD